MRYLLRCCAAAVPLLAVTSVLGVPSAFAGGPPQDPYTLNISPSSVASGSSTTFQFTYTDLPASDSPISSVVITAPSGFTVTGATPPAGINGATASFTSTTVTLKNLNTPPGHSFTARVTATTPAGSCTSNTYTWTSSVYQANTPGSGEMIYLNNPGSGQQTTVGIPAGTHLQWVSQPADALVNTTITSQAYNTSGTPIEVDVLNSCNQLVSSSDTVNLTLNQPSGAGATLSGGSVTTSNGKAVFTSPKVSAPDNGYTLTANDTNGATPSTSTQFNVSNQGSFCPQDQTCTDNTSSPNGNQATVKASPQTGSNSGFLEQSVDISTTHPLDCSAAANGGLTSPDPDTWTFKMTPSTNRSEVWTITLKHPLLLPAIQTLLAGPAQACYGSNTEFTMANGLPAPPGTLPDGTAGFIGTLPNCVSSGGFGPTGGPCIDQNNVQRPVDLTNGVGIDQIFPIDVPKGQGDPHTR